MTSLKNILLGLARKPVLRQLELEDTDLVRLDQLGFHVFRDGHLYWVKNELKDVINGSKPLELNYHGDINLNKKYCEDFQTFKTFKEAYNYIKIGLTRGELK